MKNQNRTIILASASPRRTELLKQAGIEHLVIPSTCEEVLPRDDRPLNEQSGCRTCPGKGSGEPDYSGHDDLALPEKVVKELSMLKAKDVFQKYQTEHPGESFVVIGSDTVVAAEGKILGKPQDEAEAFQMLHMLQGRIHQVYTGVTLLVCENGEMWRNTFAECSDVSVYPMSEAEIREYIATGEPMDKAGAYGIQGRFAIYIREIEGDYNNIVGLPIARVYQELKTL